MWLVVAMVGWLWAGIEEVVVGKYLEQNDEVLVARQEMPEHFPNAT